MVKTMRAGLPACSILVVDDDPTVPRLIKRVWSAEPGTVMVATRGAAALQIAARTRPDLVILGVTLADRSGTDVLRRLRDLDPGIPVIMISAHGSAGTVRSAMELGAFDYLCKPLDEEETRQVVREALASRAAPVRLEV